MTFFCTWTPLPAFQPGKHVSMPEPTTPPHSQFPSTSHAGRASPPRQNARTCSTDAVRVPRRSSAQFPSLKLATSDILLLVRHTVAHCHMDEIGPASVACQSASPLVDLLLRRMPQVLLFGSLLPLTTNFGCTHSAPLRALHQYHRSIMSMFLRLVLTALLDAASLRSSFPQLGRRIGSLVPAQLAFHQRS